MKWQKTYDVLGKLKGAEFLSQICCNWLVLDRIPTSTLPLFFSSVKWESWTKCLLELCHFYNIWILNIFNLEEVKGIYLQAQLWGFLVWPWLTRSILGREHEFLGKSNNTCLHIKQLSKMKSLRKGPLKV